MIKVFLKNRYFSKEKLTNVGKVLWDADMVSVFLIGAGTTLATFVRGHLECEKLFKMLFFVT